MQVTSTKAVEISQDENQDENMVRELAFYQQALEAARIARDKFRELDIPFSRPDDYYAEMLKSDEHMAKVRKKKKRCQRMRTKGQDIDLFCLFCF